LIKVEKFNFESVQTTKLYIYYGPKEYYILYTGTDPAVGHMGLEPPTAGNPMEPLLQI
jgi:hypothetical protein